VRFLHLTLLEANHRGDEENKMRADLLRAAPNEPRLLAGHASLLPWFCCWPVESCRH
jgi:hypothetical protein